MHNMSNTGSLWIILLIIISQAAAAADLTSPANKPRATAISRAVQAFNGTDPGAKRGPMVRLGFDLTHLYFEHQDYLAAAGPQAPGVDFRPKNILIRPHQDLVLIDAVATGSTLELRDQLVALGMRRPAVFGRYVSGLVPINALAQIAALSQLQLARPAMSKTRGGLVTSQGDPALAADVARTNFGVDGSGLTVGALSDSFDCLGQAAGDVASGDLPGGIMVLAEDPGCSSGSDEGRAIMQIVSDVAPGSSQAFHTAFGGTADFASGIIELKTIAGADVITDDVIYFAEPMFQDGVIAQAVDAVKAMGVAYFSSAGNDARHSYEVTFINSSQQGRLAGSVRHDFDPGAGTDTLQQITIPANTEVIFVLQWQQPFFSVSGAPGSASDVDMILYSAQGLARAGGIDANIGGDPVEIFSYANTAGIPKTFRLGIELNAGPAPGIVKYIYFGDMTVDEFATNSGTSYGHANAAGAQAVGAARYTQTPAYGTMPPLLESFSSAGGTPILFNTAGGAVNELRQKPEFVAPDGGDNTFFGFDYEPNGFPNFFGTSAAAPHAAGVAALVHDLDPTLTPDQIYAAMQSTAIDMGTPGADFDSGYGLIQADLALASVHPDTDGDGVPNNADNCPDAPNGPLIPDPEGSASQQDDDSDGIGNACDLLVATNALPAVTVGKTYTQMLTAVRGQPPYSWSVTEGSLPLDLTLSTGGQISGPVISSFLSFFTVQVMDANGDTATRGLSIQVNIPNCYDCHAKASL
jgi:hypothetical protein